VPAPRVSTYEYLQTPEVVYPQELVWGMVREAAAPTPRHQEAVGDFYFHLRQHLSGAAAGPNAPAPPSGRAWMAPVDVVLDAGEGLVVQPDVVVVLQPRLHLVTDRIWGAPDLVVEVMSPRPRIGSLDERLAWFARYGVRECWLVEVMDHECEIVSFGDGQITARRRFAPRQPLRSDVLPDFRLTTDHVLGGDRR
jgi:Uma2 family endonuclease